MLTNLMYQVDDFRIYEDDDGRSRLACAGWICHRESFKPVPNRDIRLVLHIPGTEPASIEIDEREVESRDVAAILGRDADASRFRLDMPVAGNKMALRSSRLQIEIPSGDQVSIAIGKSLQGDFADPEREARERDLVMRFEGLGNNCEFGLMQRKVGFNRMGLLRLAGSFDNAVLATAFETRFADFGTEDDLDMWLRGSEWMATSRRYGFAIHTYRYYPEYSEERIRADQSTMLRFQVSMLLEVVEDQTRIMLRRCSLDDDMGSMERLHTAIRSCGNADMLWVTNSVEGKPHGLVERREDGSFIGYHGRLARTAWPTEFDKDGWITLLDEAVAFIGSHASAASRAPQD